MRQITFIFFALLFLYSCSSDSENPQTEMEDTVNPEVSISFPGISQNSSNVPIVVSNQIEININASDSSGIDKVEAFIDGAQVGEDNTAPFQIIIDISGYDSKISLSSKYKDYTLTVTATDNSGNQTSIDQAINIDNELPIITSVSLIEDSILGGDSNVVTFEIEENQDLESVEIYINNQLDEIIESDNYSVNLATSSLSDGQNIFKIVATDKAENIAIYEVSFIADNTGPEITLENLIENQVLDEEITFSPVLTDEHSEVFSLSIKYNEQALFAVENPENESYDFNPAQFDTGEATITITGRDNLLNTTAIEIPVSILRRLMKINVAPQLINSDEEGIVFISTKEGELLDYSSIDIEGQNIILRTSQEPSDLEKLMLTFAINRESNSTYGDHAFFRTINDIDISVLPEINLNLKPFATGTPEQSLTAGGFIEGDNNRFRGLGSRYWMFLNSQNIEQIRFTELDCLSCIAYNTEKYYVYLGDTETEEYEYLFIEADDINDVVIDKNQFTSEGVEQRFLETSNLPTGSYNIQLKLYGFTNSVEFEGFYKHEIEWKNLRTWEFDQSLGFPYHFNANFDSYHTEVELPNYKVKSYGLPLQSIEPLDWSVDWSVVDRTVNLTKSSQGDILAEIELGDNSIDEDYVPYLWNIILNSNESDSFQIPDFPEEIMNWDFYEGFTNFPLHVEQVDIKRYDGILSYDEFLQNVIRNSVPPHMATTKSESVFKKNPLGSGESVPLYHWLFD